VIHVEAIDPPRQKQPLALDTAGVAWLGERLAEAVSHTGRYGARSCFVTIGTKPTSIPGGGLTSSAGSSSTNSPCVGGGM